MHHDTGPTAGDIAWDSARRNGKDISSLQESVRLLQEQINSLYEMHKETERRIELIAQILEILNNNPVG